MMNEVHEQILAVLETQGKALKIKEVAHFCGIDPHTAARYLDVLEILGRVRKVEVGISKKYHLIEALPVSSLIDISSDLIVILDKDQKIQYVNRRARTMLRLQDQPVIGVSLSIANLELFSRPEILARLSSFTLTSESHFDLFHQINGQMRHFEVSLTGLSLAINTPSVAVTAVDITDRQQVYNRLSEHQQILSSLASNIPGIIFRYDHRQNKTVFFNKMITRLTGYSPEEIRPFAQLPLHSLISPHDISSHISTIHQAIASGAEYTLEYIAYTKLGSSIRLYEQGRPIFRTDGTLEYIDGVVFDITAIRENEEELKAEKRHSEQLSFIIEHSSQPIVAGYPDGRMMWWNAAFEELTGYDHEILAGLNYLTDLTPIEWRIAQQVAHTQARITGEPVRYAREISGREKRPLPVEVLVQFVPDTADSPGYYYGFITDISERKRAEERIRLSEQRYRSLFDSSPVSISEDDFSAFYAWTRKPRIARIDDLAAFFDEKPDELITCMQKIRNVSYNPGFLRLFEVETNEDLTILPLKMYPPDSLPIIRRMLVALASGETIFTADLPTFTAKGKPLKVNVHVSVIPDANPPLSRVLITCVDVTARDLVHTQLKERERNLQAIFQNTETSFLIINRDYTIQAFNQTAQTRSLQIFSREIKIGDSIWLYVREQDREAFANHFEHTLAGEKIQVQLPFEGIKNTTYWFEFGFSPVHDEKGVIDRVFFTTRDVTEQRAIEEALCAANTERLLLAEESGRQGMYEIAIGTEAASFSDAFYALLGYETGSFLTSHDVWPRLIHPDDIPRLSKEREEQNQNTGTSITEFRMKHDDGHWIWVEARSRVSVSTPDGMPLTVIGVLRDITDRKKAELQLRESEMRCRQIADATSEILLMHRDGIIIEANQSASVTAGYPHESLIGMRVLDLVDSAFHPVVEEQMATGSEKPFEVMARRSDGTRIHVRITSRSVVLSGETVRLSSIRNLTEEDSIRKALSEREESFRSLVQSSPNGIFLVNEGGVVIEWNSAMTTITGITPEQALGVSYRDILVRVMLSARRSEGRIADLEGEITTALLTGRSRYFNQGIEADIINTRGEQVRIQQYVFPIRTGQGYRIGSIIRDITDEEKVRHDLMVMNLDLQAAYEEIAASEDELRKSYRALVEKQEELIANEQQLKLKLDRVISPDYDLGEEELANIIDLPEIQALMDELYATTGIGIGIVDLQGNVLVATGWQDICTRFHRVHPQTRERCIESDVYLSQDTRPAEFRAYKCKNQLWDISTPIMIGERKVGNLFLGQFFYEDEVPDIPRFVAQAREFGFDQQEYLAALARVPRWSRAKVQSAMAVYSRLATLISRFSYSNLKLARLLIDHKQALSALSLSQEKYRAYIEFSPEGVLVSDAEGRYLDVNPAACSILQYSRDELLTMEIHDIFFPEEQDRLDEAYRMLVQTGYFSQAVALRRQDGTRISVLLSAASLPDKTYIAFIIDISEQVRAQEKEAMALSRLEENIVQLSAINDQIRNPLTIISCLCDEAETDQITGIREQISRIDQLIGEVDKGWVDSMKVRSYLKRHYGFDRDADSANPQFNPGPI